MSWRKLINEAARSLTSQPVASVVTALIVAAVCAVILFTTGQTVQAERLVLAEIDAAGTRSIVISDTLGSAGIAPEAVDRIARVSGVKWVIGLGPASDVRPSGNPHGRRAPIWMVHGPFPPQIVAVTQVIPPGKALVGPDARATLGLIEPYGGVATDRVDLAIVGSFEAVEPLAFLNRGLLGATAAGRDNTVRSVHILTRSPSDVAPVAEAALAVLGADDPSSVGLVTSEALADIRGAVQGQLGRFGRRLVTVVLAVGLVLTGLSVYGAVTVRRRDFGRRRALGASRPAIVSIVAIQTTLVAIAGATIGILVTGYILILFTGAAPDLSFTLAIAILAVLAAVLGSLLPAILAAYRDPVRVLRIP